MTEATYQVRSARGGISGGTVDSLRQQIIEATSDADLRRAISDPYALTDAAGRPRGHRRGLGLRRDPGTSTWQAPFVMGVYNSQIVQRTNFLTGWAYGRNVVYREVVDTAPGLLGAAVAGGVAVGVADGVVT